MPSSISSKANEEDGPRGSICEIKAVVQRDDDIIEKEEYLTELNKKHFTSFAIVIRQVYDDDRLSKTVVDINSPHILTALKKIVTYYPAEPLDFDSPVSYDKPFVLLQTHRKEIEAYTASVDGEEARTHLQLLLDFLANEQASNAPQLERLIKNGSITFNLLWSIFKPGELVYQREYDHERLYRIQRTALVDSMCAKGWFFEISCEYTTCDGEKEVIAQAILKIWEKAEFVGKSPTDITSLSVIPLNYFPRDTEKLKRDLAARGERFLQIRGVQSFYYDGLFMYLKTPPRDHYDESQQFDGIWLPRTDTGRVVVDTKTFVEEMRREKEEESRFYGSEEDEKNPTDGQSSRRHNERVDPMLCPPYVYGYNLSLKQWCKFFINSLHLFEWVPNAMDRLIVPAKEKMLVESLVRAHRFPDRARDESASKGKGCVILLHGPPGTGKTLTAELVAEHTKRPLLKITTGELGSWSEQVAEELQQKLAYATIWKAIVLIDEADVFLEKRSQGNLRANNLVALFLRQLEYFSGVIFLTSNRVTVFDRAVQSRIHLALYYPPVDAPRRARMWRQQFTLRADERVGVDAEIDAEMHVEWLARAEMNGREIANAVHTARTLAAAEGKPLAMEHLRTVLAVWTEFSRTFTEGEGKPWTEGSEDED